MEEEGVVIEPSNFSVIAAGMNLFPDSFGANLSYRTSFDNKKNHSGINANDNKAFLVIDINLRPFAVVNLNNIEIGYNRYLHHTYFEVEDTGYAAGGTYYCFDNNTNYTADLNIGDRGLFKIDISKYYINYYFGNKKDPSPFYIGIEYADTIRPMTTNSDHQGVSHREIRFDEEFQEMSIRAGWKIDDVCEVSDGFLIKEASIFYSDVSTSDKYKNISVTRAEIEYSYGAYFEPAFKFSKKFFNSKNESEIFFSLFVSEQDTISNVSHSDEMIFWYGCHLSFHHNF